MIFPYIIGYVIIIKIALIVAPTFLLDVFKL